MKLYPKQLHSITELRREKAALEELRKQTDIKDIFSPGDIIPFLGKKDKKHDSEEEAGEEQEGNNIFGSIAGLLEDLDIGSLLKVLGKPFEAIASRKIRDKVILPLAKELLGGYLKWKAMELGFDAVKHFAKEKRKKRREEREEDQ